MVDDVGDGSGIVLWDAVTRQRLVDEPLAVKDSIVNSMAFSPDGRTVAAGYGNRKVRHGGVLLLDIAARKRSVEEDLAVNEGNVECVAFSPDGKIIAAAYRSRDTNIGGGVFLWDVAARKRLVDKPLAVAHLAVTSVAFSPNGKTILVVHNGFAGDRMMVGGVVLWDVDLESWQRRARQIANRNFTRKEWGKYFPETPYHVVFPDLPVPPKPTPK